MKQWELYYFGLCGGLCAGKFQLCCAIIRNIIMNAKIMEAKLQYFIIVGFP